jgi:hypothetical protein
MAIESEGIGSFISQADNEAKAAAARTTGPAN